VVINSTNVENRGGAGLDFDSHLPEVGSSQTFTLHFDSHAEMPGVQGLLNPPIAPTPVDARTYHAFFDVVDLNIGNGVAQVDEGVWDLTAFAVGAVAKPAPLGAGDPASRFYDIGPIAVSNGFNQQDAGGAMAFVEDTPAPGEATFRDNGGNAAVPGGGFLLMNRLDSAPWLAGITVRATAKLSVPTAADVPNFKGFRLRHDQGFGAMINFIIIQQNDASNAFGYPYIPIARDDPSFAADGPSDLIAYLDPLNGPGPDWFAPPATADIRNWVLALDIVPPSNADALPDTANDITVHSVVYEIFNEL
jgi:hypothetical protein